MIKVCKEKIAKGSIEAVINSIIKYLETLEANPIQNDFMNNILQMSNRFFVLKRKEMNGILKNSEIDLERNKICRVLIDFLDELKNEKI